MNLIKIVFTVTVIILPGVTGTFAQDAKKEKKAAKEAVMKQLLDSKEFTFIAQSANPLRGGTVNLTSEYDLKIVKDSVIAYLPFFGRAYVAPMDPSEGGIKFTSTKFTYASTLKKSGYQIIIKPTDTKDVRQLVLNAGLDGYSTLNIINQDRDPISYYGIVEPNKKARQ